MWSALTSSSFIYDNSIDWNKWPTFCVALRLCIKYTAVHLSYLKNVSVALYILFSSIEHHSVYTKIDGLQKNSLILNSFLWAAAPVFFWAERQPTTLFFCEIAVTHVWTRVSIPQNWSKIFILLYSLGVASRGSNGALLLWHRSAEIYSEPRWRTAVGPKLLLLLLGCMLESHSVVMVTRHIKTHRRLLCFLLHPLSSKSSYANCFVVMCTI